MNWAEILESIAKNGIFALLFSLLLAYVLKDGREREKKYQETISSLSVSLTAVEEIKYDVKAIAKIMGANGVVYS